MNIRKFLKWSLVLMAFLAFKQLEADPMTSQQTEAIAFYKQSL